MALRHYLLRTVFTIVFVLRQYDSVTRTPPLQRGKASPASDSEVLRRRLRGVPISQVRAFAHVFTCPMAFAVFVCTLSFSVSTATPTAAWQTIHLVSLGSCNLFVSTWTNIACILDKSKEDWGWERGWGVSQAESCPTIKSIEVEVVCGEHFSCENTLNHSTHWTSSSPTPAIPAPLSQVRLKTTANFNCMSGSKCGQLSQSNELQTSAIVSHS